MKYLIICLFAIASCVCIAQDDFLVVRLKSGAVDTIKVSDISMINFEASSSVRDSKQANTGNFPNPFSESTTFEFVLESPVDVDLQIYDLKGNIIKNMSIKSCPQGKNTIKWDSKDQKGDFVPAGTYFYEIRTTDKLVLKQMIKVK